MVILISCIIIHEINDIYFCNVCLNFLMIHLNMVLISRSRSNSRSNTKDSEKNGLFHNYILILCQSLLKWEEIFYSKVN